MKKSLFNGYCFIDENGTVTSAEGKVRSVNRGLNNPRIKIKNRCHNLKKLMAMAFCENFDPLTIRIINKNGNLYDCRLENLEFVKCKHALGMPRNYRLKEEISKLRSDGYSVSEIALMYKCSKANIYYHLKTYND